VLIKTNKLKNYKKIYESVKDVNSVYQDYVYLNFKDSKLEFLNQSCFVSIVMEIEGEDERDGLFVEGSKFFFLVQSYDEITLKGVSFYDPRGNKYSIPILNEPLSPPEEDSSIEKVDLNFSKRFFSLLKTSFDYLPKEEFSPTSALFLDKGRLMALSDTKFLSSDISDIFQGSLILPYGIAKILNSLFFEEDNISVYSKEFSNVIKIETRDMKLLFASNLQHELPVDPFSDDFKSGFLHPNRVELPLSLFEEAVKNLSSFIGEQNITPCRVIFNMEKKQLILSIETDGETSLSIPIVSTNNDDYFESKDFWIYLSYLKQSILSLKNYSKEEDSLFFLFDQDSPAVLFSLDNQEELFIVQTLLRNPEE
jgi:hypothetical protein